MEIRFIAGTAKGQSVHDGLADHARRRLRLRLRHCSDLVANVSVRIGRSGCPRAGHDAYCVMQVQLRGAPAATVADIGADAHATIDRTAGRVGRLVEEQLRIAASRRLQAAVPAAITA